MPSYIFKLHFNPFQSGIKAEHSSEFTLLKVYNDLPVDEAREFHMFWLYLICHQSSAYWIRHRKCTCGALAIITSVFHVQGSALPLFHCTASFRTVVPGDLLWQEGTVGCNICCLSACCCFRAAAFYQPFHASLHSCGLCYHLYTDDIQIYNSCWCSQILPLYFSACIISITGCILIFYCKQRSQKGFFLILLLRYFCS